MAQTIVFVDYITVSVSIPSLAAPSPIEKTEGKPALSSFIAHCKPTEQGVSQIIEKRVLWVKEEQYLIMCVCVGW